MNKQRLRDVALGFLFCLALVGSYYCGASASPTNAEASSEESSMNLSEEVRTKKLVIVNDDGQEVIIAGAGIAGDGILKVKNKSGQDLIYAGPDAEEGHGLLTVSNKSGEDIIIASSSADGDGAFIVKDKSGQELIYAGSHMRGNGAAMQLYNKTGEIIIQLLADDNGHGYIGVWDREGKGRTLQPDRSI